MLTFVDWGGDWGHHNTDNLNAEKLMIMATQKTTISTENKFCIKKFTIEIKIPFANDINTNLFHY